MIIPLWQLLIGLFLSAFVGGVAGWNCRVQSLPSTIRKQIITWRSDRRLRRKYTEMYYYHDEPDVSEYKTLNNAELRHKVDRWYR